MMIMGEFNKDEQKTADILKKLDFSRQSARHKDELWRAMSARAGGRQLSDDELDMAAGGAGEPLDEKNKKD